ncbi:type II secretion system F family protein [Helicobacter sp. 11S03491-1]|uniref:type II secretion system F family protein n=1 Tax=Helicobacter sp. 11S03491-1 TaxID=1476196 RepID=UPI000BA6CC5F|nr:type II secretion system F family protein [Helicobacter sp. 11S03491-1]PAF43369.1 hypothetical protein BKH45_01640 [Helicobacter sp. 11S03491-1]
MIIFFIFTILSGTIFLIYSIYSIWILKNTQKFMELIDISYPNLKDKEQKASLFQILMQKLIWHFRNVYDPQKGIILKGFLTTFISMLILVGLNRIFLQFNIFLVILIAIFFGAYLANVLYMRAIKNEFEKNFPQALIVISGAISSGNNITQALQDCAGSMEGILANEFKIIVRSLNMGDDPTKVFGQSYQRLPFENYYFFLTSLLVSIKSGARIKEVLSRLSTATTKAKSMEKKKNAMTSEVRMSSKITAAIPFAFLILMKFISPDNFDYIMHDPQGRYILYYFLISEGIGMGIILFLMRKLS